MSQGKKTDDSAQNPLTQIAAQLTKGDIVLTPKLLETLARAAASQDAAEHVATGTPTTRATDLVNQLREQLAAHSNDEKAPLEDSRESTSRAR